MLIKLAADPQEVEVIPPPPVSLSEMYGICSRCEFRNLDCPLNFAIHNSDFLVNFSYKQMSGLLHYFTELDRTCNFSKLLSGVKNA